MMAGFLPAKCGWSARGTGDIRGSGKDHCFAMKTYNIIARALPQQG